MSGYAGGPYGDASYGGPDATASGGSPPAAQSVAIGRASSANTARPITAVITPPNDNFANAIPVVITADGGTWTSATIDATNATTEAGEPNSPTVSYTNRKSIWFKYIPTSSGAVTIDTSLSGGGSGGNDTQIALWSGTALNALTHVASDQDSGGLSTSKLTSISVTAGTTYYLQVGAWNATNNPSVVARFVGPATAVAGIAFRATVKADYLNVDGDTKSATIPATVQAGDQLLAVVTSREAVNTPSGWTALATVNPSSTRYGRLLTRTAVAGDAGSTFTITSTTAAGTNRIGFGLVAYSGAGAIATGAVTSGSTVTSGTSLTVPSTTVSTGDVALGIASAYGSAGASTSPTIGSSYTSEIASAGAWAFFLVGDRAIGSGETATPTSTITLPESTLGAVTWAVRLSPSVAAAPQSIPVGRAVAAHAARSLGISRSVPINRAAESDAARVIGHADLRSVTIGRATTTQTARTLGKTLGGVSKALGRAGTAESARAIAPPTTQTYHDLITAHTPKLWYRWDGPSSSNQGTSGTANTNLYYDVLATLVPSLVYGDTNQATKIDLATTGGSQYQWYSADGAGYASGNESQVLEVLFSRSAADAAAAWTYAVLFRRTGNYEIRLTNTGQLQIVDLVASPNVVTSFGPATLNDGRTHMLTLVKGDSTATPNTASVDLYVDGTFALTVGFAGTWNPNWTNMYIGSDRYGSIVTIDEFQWYHNDDLTQFTPSKIAARWALVADPHGPTNVSIGRAVSANTARAVNPTSTNAAPAFIALGRAVSANAARAVGVNSPAVTIGRATSANTARPIRVMQRVGIGRAYSPTSALPLYLGYSGTSTNRVGGRSRQAFGVADWDPPVVDVPGYEAMAYDVANAFSYPTYPDAHSQPVYTVTTARKLRHRDRILVGGKDITHWRGVHTPTPSFQLIEPMLYGPGALLLPQVSAVFEKLGEGPLKFMRKGAEVLVQRVREDGSIVTTDYRGFVTAYRVSGSELVLELGGELSGRAALMNKQFPIWQNSRDVGHAIFGAVLDCGLHFEPRMGPKTGIKVDRFGGVSYADYINQLCTMAVKQNDGEVTQMWSLMPTSKGTYQFKTKNTTDVDGTIYFDDERVKPDLTRDIAEEPNRIYSSGINPEGKHIKFGVYPGLIEGRKAPYPYDNHRQFGAGTTDADTDTGDGVSVMIWKLIVQGYLEYRDQPGGYDSDVTRAIRDLQDDAGLVRSGDMTYNTWRALYDIDTTGFSLIWSKIIPAAERRSVRKWNRSASGSVMSRNPLYDPHVIKVDRNIEVGSGFTRGQIRKFSQTELRPEDNWVGTVNTKNSLIRGTHSPGDPVSADDVMPPRALRPGMNLWAPLFDGGTLFHVSGVTVSDDGETVNAMLDTQFRDTIPVWQIIERNRESRRNPARAWIKEHRASQLGKDTMTTWDEIGGTIDDTVRLDGNAWNVFPVLAGQEGTIARLRLDVSPASEFVVAIFGRKVNPAYLHHEIGDPLTKAGSRNWVSEAVRRRMDRDKILLYVAGDNDQPCGYFPKQKTPTVTTKNPDGTTTTTLDASYADDPGYTNSPNGKWEDDAGIPYRTFQTPVVYVAIYPGQDCRLPAGRIMWPQLQGSN